MEQCAEANTHLHSVIWYTDRHNTFHVLLIWMYMYTTKWMYPVCWIWDIVKRSIYVSEMYINLNKYVNWDIKQSYWFFELHIKFTYFQQFQYIGEFGFSIQVSCIANKQTSLQTRYCKYNYLFKQINIHVWYFINRISDPVFIQCICMTRHVYISIILHKIVANNNWAINCNFMI